MSIHAIHAVITSDITQCGSCDPLCRLFAFGGIILLSHYLQSYWYCDVRAFRDAVCFGCSRPLISLVPTMLMPLSVLSYASIIGILSTLLIVAVIFIDGFSKPDYPGSLWDPAPTSLGIASLGELGVSFGLFMAGVSLPIPMKNQSDPDLCTVLRTRRCAISCSGHG